MFNHSRICPKSKRCFEELNFQAKPLSTLRSENRPIKNPGSQCLDFVWLFTTDCSEMQEGEMPYFIREPEIVCSIGKEFVSEFPLSSLKHS